MRCVELFFCLFEAGKGRNGFGGFHWMKVSCLGGRGRIEHWYVRPSLHGHESIAWVHSVFYNTAVSLDTN